MCGGCRSSPGGCGPSADDRPGRAIAKPRRTSPRTPSARSGSCARRGRRGSPGTSAATTGASRARSTRSTWSRSMATSASSASSTTRCGARGRGRSCRWWRGVERRRLEERGRPDLVLCLALVHHLAIGRNLPLQELAGWLRSLDARLVVEFADRDDPMVKRLLSAKREETHESYGRAAFERALGERFEVERREELGSGTRTLYLARPR